MPHRLSRQQRNLTLTADIYSAGDDDRTFIARLLTYGEKTRDYRNMSFAPGSLNFDDDTPLAYAHQTGGDLGGRPVIIGKTTDLWDEQGAAYAEFSLADTADADEVWKLIEHGALTSVSIGGSIERYEVDADTDHLTVLEFDGYEISVVPTPAMKSARIQNQTESQLVTLANQGEDTMPDTDTNDTALTDLAATVTELQDTIRTLTDTPDVPEVTGKARGGEFNSVGELLSDVALMDRNRDNAAIDRLGALLDGGHITKAPNGSTLVNVFAFAGPGDSDDALSGGEYVDDLLRLLHQSEVTARFFQSGNLDTVPGPTVAKRKVTQGGAVDYVTEGTSITPQVQTWGGESYPKITLAGGQGVTIQARDWSDPAYMSEVVADLVEAYGEKLNLETVVGDGAAGPPPHMEGIYTAQTARHSAYGADASAQAKAFVAAIGAAKAAVYTGSKRWPAVLVAGGDVYGTIDGWTDSDGRPLLATDGPFNAIGVENGPSPVGRIRGLTCYADDAVPADTAYIASFRDAKLWQSAGAPAQVALLYPDQLTIDVSIYGYSALAIRRPGSFAVIEGIGKATTRAKK